ncbi:cGMP-specific 3',5'-cyclic phosphodiesterase-like [Marmota monax]|uniref:cGMP-specific 3',5'-cyclic phosphodiesterase-like n=1 Tax=Marmota monax TaxID=9995 RepID=UPI001EB08BBD|nr:cGMP-specific 3',5'-cyclic phosphodiesterase-like [Marmota monax]
MQTGQENSRAHPQVLRRPGPDGGFPLVLTGVCQLVNKRDESTGEARPFSRSDEQFLEAFVIFCGLGIQNTQMYEAVERAMAQQMVTLEVLSYHASAAEEETRELQALAVSPSSFPRPCPQRTPVPTCSSRDSCPRSSRTPTLS